MNDSPSKIGHGFRKYSDLKLASYQKINLTKKCAPKLLFFIGKGNQNDSVDSRNKESTLKVRFWHFLPNCPPL